MRPAQEDRARAVPAVHHPPAQGAGARRHDQVGQEDARAAQRGGLGHPRGGDPQPPGAPEPGPDPAPHGHPGVRAGAGRGQRDPHPPAGLQGVQRRLRRRPDGRAPAAVDRGAGRGHDADDGDQQHLQPGQRQPDHQPDPGHRHGGVLPDRQPPQRARGRHDLLHPQRGLPGPQPGQGRRARDDQAAAAGPPPAARRRREGIQARHDHPDDGRPRRLQRHPPCPHAVLQPDARPEAAPGHHRRLLPDPGPPRDDRAAGPDEGPGLPRVDPLGPVVRHRRLEDAALQGRDHRRGREGGRPSRTSSTSAGSSPTRSGTTRSSTPGPTPASGSPPR